MGERVQVAFCYSGIVFLRGFYSWSVCLSLWYQHQSRGEIINVEFEFALLVGRIERRGDSSLPCCCEEGDDERVAVGKGDRDGGARRDSQCCELLLEIEHIGVELRVGDLERRRTGDNDRRGRGGRREGVGESAHAGRQWTGSIGNGVSWKTYSSYRR